MDESLIALTKNVPNWLEIANFTVLTATLLALIAYTRKTAELAKAIQRQNETAIRPILALQFIEDMIEGSPNFPVLANIGFGPALNITIKHIVNGDYHTEFKPIPLLPKGASTSVQLTTYYRGDYDKAFSPTMQYFVAMLKDRTSTLTDVLELSIEISCCDANGKAYLYKQTLECKRPMMSIRVSYAGSSQNDCFWRG